MRRLALALPLLLLAACAPEPQEAPAPGVPDPGALACAKGGGRIIAKDGSPGGWCQLPSGLMVDLADMIPAT